MCCRQVTKGENTFGPADSERARELHTWVRGRLSRETLSGYVAYASEPVGDGRSHDLVVQVVHVDPGERVLAVTDGSTAEPLRVRAAEPDAAARWVFMNV